MYPRPSSLLALCAGLAACCLCLPQIRADHPNPERRIPVALFRDRMTAGWIGQMAGVAWGAPTEFHFTDRIIPEDQMPAWSPQMINNAFGQDDLYVEMTFLRTLERLGLDAPAREAGIDFANSKYPLWWANDAGRKNLRAGIAPPDSGHPRFNHAPNAIDYQIEADFSGLIAPGMPQLAIDLGERFGRIMNYGDGMIAGQFIGALYAEAYFTRDLPALVENALKAIPPDSQYAQMARDILAWYRANPDDWQATWNLCQKKYREDPEFQKASDGGIDCKINGAYVLIGLLHGKGDPDQTIIIACRCGQDSDCNPSSAAGILFTTLGLNAVPDRFFSALDRNRKFDHTDYSFNDLLKVSEQLARQAVARQGGRIEKNPAGEELFVIPLQPLRPSAYEKSWDPGPIAGSRFTPDERARITESNKN
jgi:hypothetical protein